MSRGPTGNDDRAGDVKGGRQLGEEDMLQTLARVINDEEYEAMIEIVAHIGLRLRGNQES